MSDTPANDAPTVAVVPEAEAAAALAPAPAPDPAPAPAAVATTTVVANDSALGKAVLSMLPAGVTITPNTTLTITMKPVEEKKAAVPPVIAVVTPASAADQALFIPADGHDVSKRIDNEPLNPAKTITGGKYIREVLPMETGGTAKSGYYHRYLAAYPYTPDGSQILLIHRTEREGDRVAYQFRVR